LSQRPWRLPKLPQMVRGRTLDIDVNIVLALALDRMAPHQVDLSDDHRKRFAHLRDVWGGISRSTRDVMSLVNSVQAAPPHGYRRALQIAKLILLGATLDPQHGVGGRVFTVSLANVWERGLEKMFAEVQSETGWRVVPANERIRHWDDSAGRDDASRWMVADLILERQDQRAVLDAKYKCDFGNESRTDRFQVCAYAIAFDSKTVTLVYPQESTIGTRKLLETDFGSNNVKVWSVTLPMNQGPATCRSRVRDFAIALSS
jgi:5-methylcytosine-specific restriction endonuclease McrBC regulatory subunit McrC